MSSCFSCNNAVESSVVEAEGRSYHPACFKCEKCLKSLVGSPYGKHEEKIMCGDCINEATKVVRSFVTKPNTTYLRGAKPITMNVGGGQDKCVRCSKSVYANEKTSSSGNIFHRTCFRCNECKRSLELGKECNQDSEVYCSSCHMKKFGPKGFGIGSHNIET